MHSGYFFISTFAEANRYIRNQMPEAFASLSLAT